MPKKPYEINLPDTPRYGGRMPTLHHFTSAYSPQQALSQILKRYGCLYLNDEFLAYWHSHPGMIIEREMASKVKKPKNNRAANAWNAAAERCEREGDWTRFHEYAFGKKKRR